MTPRPPFPPWSYPLLLALTGIVIFVGGLPVLVAGLVGAEVAVTLAYLVATRMRPPARKPVSNLVALLPGHLLVLLALTLVVDGGGSYGYLWLVLPVATLGYDAAFRWRLPGRLALSIPIILYAILWASLITLLERIVVLARGVGGQTEFAIAAVFGVAGVGFIALGVYRHWHAWTAAKE
ncbi:MAG: hypothetical protein JSW65_05650 [Candidatus Bipolaricaulota bacterium]|nr:MAG: hypothetical protein JSW65_05650 [Candidatus Bipolaricaulota bacterium]